MAISRRQGVTRRNFGERHPKAVLPDKKVRELRRVRNERGLSYAKLGRMFGCSTTTAYNVCNGETRWSA